MNHIWVVEYKEFEDDWSAMDFSFSRREAREIANDCTDFLPPGEYLFRKYRVVKYTRSENK